jgi:hypothetical protein
MQNAKITLENNLTVSYKVTSTFTISSSNSTSWYLTERSKILKTYVFRQTYVYMFVTTLFIVARHWEYLTVFKQVMDKLPIRYSTTQQRTRLCIHAAMHLHTKYFIMRERSQTHKSGMELFHLYDILEVEKL